MKFAHLADCHIGSWREPRLNDFSTLAFKKAVDICKEKKIDFMLIAGDLFNTAYPSIDKLKEVTKYLKELKDSNIRVYMIAGSHDFSVTGKTMLDVLEKAGLAINVVKGDIIENKLKLKFTIDPPTGVKITGMLGKKGQLEKGYYEQLMREHLEQESGYKIFMFHTAITELKPEEFAQMEATEISYLPKNFNYYAGGHVHIVKAASLQGYTNVVYPGPLFPNSFAELEKLKHGGFYLGEYNEETKQEIIQYVPIVLKEVQNIVYNVEKRDAHEIMQQVEEQFENIDVKDKIITIRLWGKLSAGKRNDMQLTPLIKKIYDRGAYLVLKHTTQLITEQFEELKIAEQSVGHEEALIKEHLGQIPLPADYRQQEKELVESLMSGLVEEKKEGETKTEYEKRIKTTVMAILHNNF